jgi:hypothetical protein
MIFPTIGLIICGVIMWLVTILLKLVHAPCYARDLSWFLLLLPITALVTFVVLFAIGATFFFMIFQLISIGR